MHQQTIIIGSKYAKLVPSFIIWDMMVQIAVKAFTITFLWVEKKEYNEIFFSDYDSAGSIPTHHWLRQRKCRKELRSTTCLSNWSDYFKRPAAAVYEWKKSSDRICAVDVNDEYLPSWCLLHLFNKILFLRWFCSVCSEMCDGEVNIKWAMTKTWWATLINI